MRVQSRSLQIETIRWYNKIVLSLVILLLPTLVLARTVPDRIPDKRISTAKAVLKISVDQGYEDPHLVVGLVGWESGFSAGAVSSTGDYGLAQVNCDIWLKALRLKRCRDLKDIRTNVLSAITILTRFQKKYKDCRGPLVLSCYFRGQNWRAYDRRCRAAGLRGCTLTTSYRSHVLAYAESSRRTLGEKID